jgi:1-acyl-sn-glycerol-3-phosphate acyltransferase
MALWTIVTTLVYTLIIGIPVILIALLSRTGRAPYLLGKLWVRLIMATNRVRVQVSGLENLAKRTSYVFISNHMSNLDPLAVARSIPNTLKFVAKKSLARIPVFGWAAKLARMIFIDRADSAAAIETINRYIKDLKNGISAFFFAEGTRSVNGAMKPFKKGGIVFAIKAQLPIVPVTILGSNRLMPKNSVRIRAGIMRIIVGRPIETRGFTLGDRDLLLKKVESVIRATLEVKAGEMST